MDSAISYKKEVAGTLDVVVSDLGRLLLERGFGLLDRIELEGVLRAAHRKGAPAAVVICAHDPELTYAALCADAGVAPLALWNAVARAKQGSVVAVEIARPSRLLGLSGDGPLLALAEEADRRLASVIAELEPALG